MKKILFKRLFACAALLVASTLAAQSDSQNPFGIDSSDGLQNSTQCPSGTFPTILGDGSQSCTAPSPQTSRQQPQLGNRPNSVAGQAESEYIGSQERTRTSQSRQQLPPEPLTEFQKFVAATTGQVLPIYGAKLFRNVPTTFAPSDLTPVTSDYVVGPNDELRVRIWGQITYSGNLRVDRSGDIYLPEAGAVHVAGLTFSQLDQHLRSAVGRVYRNFDLAVDMGRIRSMQVYVTGQARRPGAYTVSSLSSLIDALFASGGPSAQGSLRHIELRRDGKTVVDFDLYALLIHGDKSNDARLLPEDVLFIPPTGPQVAITGSVHSPGIYELHGKETIADLIDAAGKTTAVAASTRISVERLGDHQIRQAMEFTFDTTGMAVPLSDSDIVRVYAVVPAYQKTVTLRGNVANPGRFAWHPGMHLSDLIPDRDSLLSRDYWWKRSHLGLPTPEFEPFIPNFDENQRRPNRSNPFSPHYPYPNTPDGQNPNPNNPSGNVNQYPNVDNSYDQSLSWMSAQDALAADLSASDRQDPNYTSNENQRADRQASEGSVASQLRQRGEDATTQTKRTDVRLNVAEIYWSYAVIERLDSKTLKTSLVPFDLGHLIDHDSSQDLALEPGDAVTVFSHADIRVPQEQQTKYIRLEGEFVHAGIYSVRPGETLRDLVSRAGGFTHNAYLYGSEFDRESTRKLQQERIDEYVQRVDLDSERGNLALTVAPSSSAGTLASATAATAAEQQLIARLKLIRATGRVVMTFRPDSSSLDDVPAIALENGDRFLVPSQPATVNVVGAVYDQNSFLYGTGGSTAHYLTLAGGPDRNADSHRTFVIRADGSVVSRDASKGQWKSLTLNPGDTIVVPDKTIRPTALRGLLDWTQIFSQLALGAAAINVLRE